MFCCMLLELFQHLCWPCSLQTLGPVPRLHFRTPLRGNRLHQQTFEPFPPHEAETKLGVTLLFCSRWNLCACFCSKARSSCMAPTQWVKHWCFGKIKAQVWRVNCSERLKIHTENYPWHVTMMQTSIHAAEGSGSYQLGVCLLSNGLSSRMQSEQPLRGIVFVGEGAALLLCGFCHV